MGMPRDLILGTAGHIDHGKTSLVKALTGIDCDRLPEEKSRGITIDLGFAHLELDSFRLGIVDVPGHERFIKNMLSGATGFDLVLLVIAADDSIMPQTREHLDILKLLGIRHGVVAITKADLVDSTTLEVAQLEVQELLQGTPLHNAPIIPTSVFTGQGIAEIKQALREQCQRVAERTQDEWFRLAIDRSFTVQGYGTVVTGSVASGSLRVGDEVAWLPNGALLRVRGLQNHEQSVDEIHRGMRAAINLAGVKHEEVIRGQELATPGYIIPSRIMTLQLNLLPEMHRSIKHRSPVRLHIGTAEIMGTLSLLEANQLEPGQSGLVQVFLEEPGMAVWGQPFVVRDPAATHTIGGGIVLQPVVGKIRRRHIDTLTHIEALAASEPEVRALNVALLSGFRGIGAGDLVRMAGLAPTAAERMMKHLLEQGQLMQITSSTHRSYTLHADLLRTLKQRITETLQAWHDQAPLLSWHDRGKLVTALAYIGDDSFVQTMLDRLLEEKELVGDQRRIALASHKPKLSQNQRKLKEKMIESYLAAAYQPPDPQSFTSMAGGNAKALKDLFDVCVAENELVPIHPEMFLHSKHETAMRERLRGELAHGRGMTVGEIKDVLGTSRKYAVPLCEYLDRIGLTRRDGDLRYLASATSPVTSVQEKSSV